MTYLTIVSCSLPSIYLLFAHPLSQIKGTIIGADKAKLSQTRPNILKPNFLTGFERIETQNLSKAQALGALPAVAVLIITIVGANLAKKSYSQTSCVLLHNPQIR